MGIKRSWLRLSMTTCKVANHINTAKCFFEAKAVTSQGEEVSLTCVHEFA